MRTQPQKIISPHTNVTLHAITQYIFLFFFRQLMFKKSKKGKGRCYRTQNWSLTRINSHITYRAVGIGGAGGNPPHSRFWLNQKQNLLHQKTLSCLALAPHIWKTFRRLPYHIHSADIHCCHTFLHMYILTD